MSSPTENDPKALLTQEFNTISTNNTMTTVNNENTPYTGGSFPSSLPFLINPDTQNSHGTNNSINNFPALFYQPIPFAASPEQLQQYFLLMQQQQQRHFTRPSVPPIPMTSNKRIKVSSEVNLSEQLNNFKNSLKNSFDKNLQKLEVLDRLVQTVTIKGNFQIENVKNALEMLSNSKEILKQMISEQVDFTANLTSDLKNFLKFDLLSNLKLSFSHVDSSKTELVDKLRREEDSHLTDLTILSTRNKELQKETKCTKEQLEKLQLEYSESLKTSFKDKEEHENFKRTLIEILDCENEEIINSIEMLLNDNVGLKEKISFSYKDMTVLHLQLQDLKTAVMEQETCFESPSSTASQEIQMAVITILNVLFERFEEILFKRESFYNLTILELKSKIENLIQNQSNLAHQSLNQKISLQGQLADSNENVTRLRKHCQELTLNLNNAASELDKKRIILQEKDYQLNEFKRKTENLMEKLKSLEQEISIKNQESRTLGIRIQGLQSELEENSIKHRHDISALERKISVLETKSSTTNNLVNEDILNMDPFSSLGRRESLDQVTAVGDISVIPSTVNPVKKTVVVTFTGIRDAQKQKELGSWLMELGATVHVGADFNDDITHVLAPRGYKSIRVLAASLTGKWIVPAEWVEACHRTNQFVSENLHGGYQNTSIRPFRFRTIWLSSAFAATHKAHPVYPTAALRVLLEKLGKARWCESAGQADFLLVTEEEKESKLIWSSRGVLLNLNNLINMIPIE